MWCIRKCIVYVYVTNGRIIPRCCYLIFSWSFCISVSLQWRVSPCSLMRLLQLLSISSTSCFEVLRSFRRPARRDTFSSRSFLRCRTKSIRVSEYLCISVSVYLSVYFYTSSINLYPLTGQKGLGQIKNFFQTLSMGLLSDMKWLVSREWLLCSSQINSFNLTYLVFRPWD